MTGAKRARSMMFPMDFPPYPSGLRLGGRRVVVVGGGSVAQRRVPQLIAAGADVHVVSPEATPAIEGLVGSGEVTWHRRRFEDADLEGAWYVVAVTDDPAVNDRVSELAEQQRIFCVRSDDATRGGPRPCATRCWRGCGTAGSPRRTTGTGRRVSRWSVAARATRS